MTEGAHDGHSLRVALVIHDQRDHADPLDFRAPAGWSSWERLCRSNSGDVTPSPTNFGSLGGWRLDPITDLNPIWGDDDSDVVVA